MLACLGPAHPRNLPVMPVIVPVVPAVMPIVPAAISPAAVSPAAVSPTAIAPSPAAISPTKVRPFAQQRGISDRILPFLERNLGNSCTDFAEALGDARDGRLIFSIRRSSLRLHSGEQCGNSQNAGGKQDSKRLFHSVTHSHGQTPAVLMRATYHRVYVSSTRFLLNPGQQEFTSRIVSRLFSQVARRHIHSARDGQSSRFRREGGSPQLRLGVRHRMPGRFFLCPRRLDKARPSHFFCHGGERSLVPRLF